MQRLTARILLVLLLVSVMAPTALASFGPQQHACCMRKPTQGMHSSGPGFTVKTDMPGRGNCCPPMATSHWANTASHQLPAGFSPAVRQAVSGLPANPSSSAVSLYPSRAPPVTTIT